MFNKKIEDVICGVHTITMQYGQLWYANHLLKPWWMPKTYLSPIIDFTHVCFVSIFFLYSSIGGVPPWCTDHSKYSRGRAMFTPVIDISPRFERFDVVFQI